MMQEKSLRIRNLTMADIPAVQEIEHSSFSDPWTRITMEDAVASFSDTAFIAESSGKICGYIICGVEDTSEEIFGHICSLAVRPDMRKRGVGTTLMRRAEHAVMLEQASAMQLEVRISNLPAIRFYKKMGYEPVFQVCGYYSDTEDAIVMMKWFRYKNAKALLF